MFQAGTIMNAVHEKA